MGNLSAHFDKIEFRCPCGCGEENPSKLLITRLEQVFDIMDAASIIVSSGYRCQNYSPTAGGYRNDAHTCNIAPNIIVNKKGGGCYKAEDIAEVAERVGFGGIGLMNNSCHVDDRDCEPYVNNHWFGDERDGRNNVKTFQRGTVFPGEKYAKKPAEKKTMKVTVNYDDHEFTGLLEEI